MRSSVRLYRSTPARRFCLHTGRGFERSFAGLFTPGQQFLISLAQSAIMPEENSPEMMSSIVSGTTVP